MEDLQTLAYGSKAVRTVNKDGEIWFVAKDICGILEVSDVESALRRLEDDEKGTDTIRTLGGDQTMRTVNESGLYNLIFTSRKPEALAFRKWVTSEVLPAIRKTGFYGSAKIDYNDYLTLAEKEVSRLRVRIDQWWRQRPRRMWKTEVTAIERGIRSSLPPAAIAATMPAMYGVKVEWCRELMQQVEELIRREQQVRELRSATSAQKELPLCG